MKLLELDINKILLLDKHRFKNNQNSIDYLNNLALKELNSEKRLAWLKIATAKVEKFHSYFHFEQSYFHLQLAKALLKQQRLEQAEEQLKAALFQDPLNLEAKAISIDNNQNVKEYKRVYENFLGYLFFATEENEVAEAKALGYWQDYLDYQKNQEEIILGKIIEQIRWHHLNYHIEAAKLYLNRALVFHQLGSLEIAKNDIRKANYLDNKIQSKAYYLTITKIILEN
ncbi:MAG: hypothetical protein WBJ81_02460 [Rickettsiales bacterium]